MVFFRAIYSSIFTSLLVMGTAYAQDSTILPKNFTPNSNVPMRAADIPMAPRDVPMAPVDVPMAPPVAVTNNSASETKLIRVENEISAIDEQPRPLRKPVNNGDMRMIQVEELQPTEPDATDSGTDENTEPMVLPDPNGAEPEPVQTVAFDQVSLFGINKISARSEEIQGKIGDTLRFKNLEIIVHRCQSILDNGEKGVAALIEITEARKGDNPEKILQGWMFSTSPSLFALEHPLYDIVLKNCSVANVEKIKNNEATATVSKKK